VPIPSLFDPATTTAFLQRRGLLRVPQHPLAAEPCCLKCGHRDGRTAVGGLRCHNCTEAEAR
jgi:hypothetical protein